MLQQWALLASVVIVVLSYCEQQVQAQFFRRGFGLFPHKGPLGGLGAHRRPHLGWVLAANPNAHEDDGDQAIVSRSADEKGYEEDLQVVHYGDHVEDLQDLGLEPSPLIGFYNEDGTVDEWSGVGEELVDSGAEEMVGRKHQKLDCHDIFGKHKKKKRKFCRKMGAYDDDHYGHGGQHSYGHDSYGHGHGGYGGHKHHKHHKHGNYGRYKRHQPYLSGAQLPLQQLPLGGLTSLTHSLPLAGTLRQLPVHQLTQLNRHQPPRRQDSSQNYGRYKRQLPYFSDSQQLPLGIPQIAQSTPLSGAVQLLPVQQITQINRPRLVRNSSLKAPVKRQLFNTPSQFFPQLAPAGSSLEERRQARQKYLADLRSSRAGFFENVGKAFQGMGRRAATTTTTPPPFPMIAAIRKNFESSMQNLNARLAYRDPTLGAVTSTDSAGPVVAPAPPPEPCTCDKCTPVRRSGQRGQRQRQRNGGNGGRANPRARPRARARNSDPRASSASSLAAEIKQAAPSSPIVGASAPEASAVAKPAVASTVYPREFANSLLNAVNKFIQVPAASPEMVGSSAQNQEPIDPARTISKTIARVIDYMYPDQAPPPAPVASASELVGSVGPKVSAPKKSDMQFVEGMQRMLNTYQKELVGKELVGGKKSCSSQRCR